MIFVGKNQKEDFLNLGTHPLFWLVFIFFHSV